MKKRKPQIKKSFTEAELKSFRNSPFLLKEDEEVRKELGDGKFQDSIKQFPTKNSSKSLKTKSKSIKKPSNKSNPRKLKRFTKAQLEAIRNSPMFVRKNEAADKFFSSPGYKAISRDLEAKKKIKNSKKKPR